MYVNIPVPWSMWLFCKGFSETNAIDILMSLKKSGLAPKVSSLSHEIYWFYRSFLWWSQYFKLSTVCCYWDGVKNTTRGEGPTNCLIQKTSDTAVRQMSSGHTCSVFQVRPWNETTCLSLHINFGLSPHFAVVTITHFRGDLHTFEFKYEQLLEVWDNPN